jgi:hypothetical protein
MKTILQKEAVHRGIFQTVPIQIFGHYRSRGKECAIQKEKSDRTVSLLTCLVIFFERMGKLRYR